MSIGILASTFYRCSSITMGQQYTYHFHVDGAVGRIV